MKRSVATLCKSKAMPEMAAAPRTSAMMSIPLTSTSLSTSSSMKQSLAMKPQAVAYAAMSMNFP
jgi:hypothetical protein